jgi:hypothetical protein
MCTVLYHRPEGFLGTWLLSAHIIWQFIACKQSYFLFSFLWCHEWQWWSYCVYHVMPCIAVPCRLATAALVPILCFYLYYLTLWSWVPLERPQVVQLLGSFPAFYGTRRFITEFIRALHLYLSWARPNQSTTLNPISKRSILMLSIHLLLFVLTQLFMNYLLQICGHDSCIIVLSSNTQHTAYNTDISFHLKICSLSISVQIFHTMSLCHISSLLKSKHGELVCKNKRLILNAVNLALQYSLCFQTYESYLLWSLVQMANVCHWEITWKQVWWHYVRFEVFFAACISC